MRGRAGEEPVPRMTNAVRLDRRTILPRTDKRIVGEADAEPQQLLRLPQAPRPKLGNHDEGQGYGAALCTLRRLARTPALVCSALSTTPS